MKVLFSLLLIGLATVSCAQNRVSQAEFKKLMKDATLRNKIFFKKLQLE